MANFNNSANMSLPIPVAGVDPGPDYALNINSCLTVIDSHDHSSGKGVQVTPAGLNINADLTFQQNNLTNLKSSRFTPQNSILVGSSDLGCLYEVGVDLYYNDGNGNNIRITQSGGVAGTPGSIANLTSPASAEYVSASSTFVWQSDANTPANLDAASIILRNLSAGSNGLTLNPPSAMGANYDLTLPALPASQKIMTLDAAGNMSAPYTVDGSTISINANTLLVPTGGITTTQIASNTIVAGNIANATITGAKLVNATITTTQIASNTIVDANISSSAAIAGSKFANNVALPGLATANSKNIIVANTVSVYALQVARGSIDLGNGSPSIISGEGFTVSSITTTLFEITFTTAFAAAPTVVVSGDDAAGFTGISNGFATTTTKFRFVPTNTTGIVSFIAIGQR